MNGSPCGKPISLPVPCSMNASPATMRNTDCSAGARARGMTVSEDENRGKLFELELVAELIAYLLKLGPWRDKRGWLARVRSEDLRHLVERKPRTAREQSRV